MENLGIEFSFIDKNTGEKHIEVIYDFSVNIFSQDKFNYLIDEISWKYLGKKIKIKKYDELYEIKYVCPVHQHILIIFKFEEITKFVVVNYLGELIKEVSPPKLISKTAQLFELKHNITFNSAYWNNVEEKLPLIDLGFNNDYYEVRLFEINNFEFKESVQSGRM